MSSYKNDGWLSNGLFRHYDELWATTPNLGTAKIIIGSCDLQPQDFPYSTTESASAAQEVVSKIETRGNHQPLKVQTQKQIIMKHNKRTNIKPKKNLGRPRKDNKELSRTSRWRRQKELQGGLL